MKNILKISFILLIPMFIHCKEDSVNNDVVSIGVDLSYKDQLGHDLLDPNSPIHYDELNIRNFYVVNGKKIEVYDGRMDNPKGIKLYKNDSLNKYILGVGLNSQNAGNDTTLLCLSENITDTIIGLIDKSNNNIVLKKVWYNGVLEWEFGSTSAQISIIK